MRYTEYTLADLSASVNYGYTASADFTSQGPKFLRITDIRGEFVDWSKVPSCEISDKDMEKYKLNMGDIVVARTGATTGINAIIEENLSAVFASYLIRFKINLDLANPFYVHLNMRTNRWDDFVQSVIGGSAQPGANAKQLSKFKIKLPPLEIQNKVVDLIYPLIKKHKLNINIIHTLESFSSTLFKNWFIDFEFPNEQGLPYKSNGGRMVESELGSIPETFKIVSFNEISKLTMGLSPKSDTYNEIGNGMPLLNGAADFDGNKLVPNKYTTDSKRNSSIGDLVFCIRATIGNISYSDKAYSLGRSVAAITPFYKNYYEIIHFNLERQINQLKSQAVGSVIVGLSKPDIENIKLSFPDKETLNKFHILTSEILNLTRTLSEENKNLVTLRDTLLPKLLSGEIELLIKETVEN